jgi:sucrose-6-phosphate hydrolase SacC (GH32 family)
MKTWASPNGQAALLPWGLVTLLGFVSPAPGTVRPASYYSEPFRPQFHFTPEKNWMNDPNGLVYFKGEYHLFYQHNPLGDKWGHMSWGHAVSRDLCHWQHLPLAIPGEQGVMTFSGSAVVDWRNTSGFGRGGQPPMVAIYTGHRSTDDREFQCIAYSNDRGRTWTKYAGNPVVDIQSRDFRDPKVQWHGPTGRWIMTVALAAEHRARFYGSANLREWTLLSEFGPAGVTSGVWECPDLFELRVEQEKSRRWVLVVNLSSGSVAGGSGGQYFVGQFDGTRFIPDPESTPRSASEFVPDGVLLADFEGADYGDWKTTGEAFGSGPAQGSLPGQNPVSGFKGRGLVNSFYHGDGTQGTLTSPEFAITRPFVVFLIGGGAHEETCLNLRVDGKVVRTASGKDDERLEWRSWNVREFAGQRGRLEVVDRRSDGWGHINVDRIMLADVPARAATERSLWLDYGKDYYASSSWNDIPKSDGRRVSVGWMSNCQYAQELPTAPWRSAMSVPRVLTLYRTGDGLRLRQQPVTELRRLRAESLRFPGGTFAKASAWLARQGSLPPLLEVELALKQVAGKSPFSLAIHCGTDEQISILCDAARGQLSVDRTHSGLVGFHGDFPGRHTGPLRRVEDRFALRLLLDTSSLEIFAQNGETVWTELIFPTGGARSLSLTASGSDGPAVAGITLHKLKTAWISHDSRETTR